jgi:protein-disulfide isomerase
VLDQYKREVKLVYKNYPLRSHKVALKAAIAALAAERQGKFWEFHDLLFKNFNRLSDQKIRDISQDLGLDMETFQKDLKDPKIMAAIGRDVSEGAQAGVQGTPTIFINGRLLRNRSLEGFQSVIDKELGRLRKGVTSNGGP